MKKEFLYFTKADRRVILVLGGLAVLVFAILLLLEVF